MMTRVDLLKEINKIIMVTSSKYLDDVIESKNKILECYDDFESRTCESCKWYKQNRREDYGWCEAVSTTETISLVDKDFGCNKWEKRDD